MHIIILDILKFSITISAIYLLYIQNESNLQTKHCYEKKGLNSDGHIGIGQWAEIYTALQYTMPTTTNPKQAIVH